jgi:hypothetical protein
MRKIVRGLLPSPALIVACLALFVALGGVGYAALNGKDKRKVRAIADQAITKKAAGLSVASAANADKLGGIAPSGYQSSCAAGAIKATAVVNTAGLGATFTNVPGFNCFQPGNLTSSVQVERVAQGDYRVRFVGNSGPNASGSAVVSSVDGNGVIDYFLPNPSPVPGENVFGVVVRNAAGNPVDDGTFSLLAF